MSNKNHYVIINGKAVSSQQRRSLDGLSTAGPARALQQTAATRPTAVKTVPKQSSAVKPLTTRVPKKASSIHQKQVPAARRKRPAQNIVFVNTHRRKPADHSNHKLPQSAALTEARQQRAEYHRQSHHVTRFGALSDHSFREFRQAPSRKAQAAGSQAVAQVIPQAGPPAKARTINQQIAQYHARSHAANGTRQAQQVTRPSQRLAGLFSSRRIVSLTAASISVLILIGYAAYLNAPNLALRVAASRAGIEATMPGYRPSGFALNGPIEYTDGEVVINYKANADQRQFSLVQRESEWDSRSLLENYVTREASRYEVVEEDGLTIYTYNGSDAAWVNRGLLFVIEGESLLDRDQISRLATSL